MPDRLAARLTAPCALILSACATWDPATDRDAFVAALADADLDRAEAACARIGQADLRGECQVEVAGRVARERGVDAARARCATLEPSTWRRECWFVLADEVGASGAVALDLCARTGAFEGDCVDHALWRDLHAAADRHGIGDETALLDAIDAALVRYDPDLEAEARAGRRTRIAAGQIAQRLRRAELDTAACGKAPAALCVEAYLGALSVRPGDPRLAEVCRSGPSAASTAPLTGVGWTDAAIAGPAWTRLCTDLAAEPPR